MSWQRNIPFGYQMNQGAICVNKAEADMVKRIYLMYISGNSLNAITYTAESFGIHYHDGSRVWNKNMIKRILDNRHYVGDSVYPRIIDYETYMTVRLINREKQSKRNLCDVRIQPITKKMTCSTCESKMHRHTKRGRPRWICSNESCRETLIIADDTLCTEIDRTLALLAQSPALLDPCAPDKQQVTSDVLRLQNELTAAFNRGTESPEYMRSLIFALAAEQYNALSDMNLIHTLRELKDKIAAEGLTEDNRREIEQKAVRRILLGRESGVSIELINGKVISSKEEAEQ